MEKVEGAYDVVILKQKIDEIIGYLNSQDQEEICTHDFDLNNRCTKCGVRGVKDMIAELQDTPEEWEEEWYSTPVYNQIPFIKDLLDKAREEVLTELQEEFSEFGVPDDVRYTKPLFYINEIIEEKLSKLKQ